MHSPRSNERRRPGIVPGFQKSLCIQFVGLAGVALCAQYLYLTARVGHVAERVSQVSDETLAEHLPSILLEVFALSVAILLPLLLGLAAILTRHVAGPLFGLERYLHSVATGVTSRPFRMRDGDRIENIQNALNAALQRAREDGVVEESEEPARSRKAG